MAIAHRRRDSRTAVHGYASLKKLCSPSPLAVAVAAVALCAAIAPGAAQSTLRMTMQGQAEKSTGLVLRDALGRPCLDIEAAARNRIVNPDMIDHIVSIKNICPRLIKVKVCYVSSTRCNDEDVQAYKRVDTILGTMKGVSFFRYTINWK